MPRTLSPPSLTTLILLTAVSTLSLQMFLPSLANIARDFEVSYAQASLAIGGYLAITAVIQLIIGPLSDRLGRRPVMIGSLVVFTLASIGCALAQNIWAFLAFRMLQGGITSGYVLSLAIVRDTRGEQAAAGLIGYISMVMAIAPLVGPMFGGFLDAAFGWRANFFLYAGAGLTLLALCWFDLGETRPEHGRAPDQRRALAALLRAPRFWAFALCEAFSRGAFYIFITGAPLVAQVQFGVSTAALGIYIGIITAGFILGTFLSGRFAPRTQPITMMIAGRIVACGGLLAGITIILFGNVSPALFFGATIAVGVGNGITTPSSSAAAMSVHPESAGSAAGLAGALSVAGGAVLTTLTGALLPDEAPALALLVLMLASSALAFAAVLAAIVLQADRGARGAPMG
ncbi:MAG: multidrug effflux MFS transporter [Pseudomonadota bacterium]